MRRAARNIASSSSVVVHQRGHRCGDVAADELGRLLNAVLGVLDEVVRTDIPQRPDITADLCGWYALPGPPTLTDVRVRGFSAPGSRCWCAAASSSCGC
jgi:hypothetical protein